MFDAILVSGVDSAGVGRHRWLFWILTAVTLATRWWHLLSESARALDLGAGARVRLVASMIYLSLVYITTLGFGDVVPGSDLAKPIAALEGMFGQLYLAVLIARLVGLHLASEANA